MTMRDRIKEGTVQQYIKDIEMRIRFAEVCLNHSDVLRNEEVYNALSHLSKIDALNISLMLYERLRVPPENSRLNVDVFLYARNKLADATLLLEDILKETYAVS